MNNIDDNFLGHEFIYINIMGNIKKYICNKCKLEVFAHSTDNFVQLWQFCNFEYSELKYTCDEMIIKDIIE